MSSQFSRLVEADIMAAIPSDEEGDSEIVSVNFGDKLSCQAIYVVDTPVGATVTFKGSNDGVNWTNLQSATSIAGDGTVMLEQPEVAYRWFKATKALTSGDVDLKCLVLVTGDAI